MNRSAGKILTTHVGSLPQVTALGNESSETQLREAVAAVIAKQNSIGIDVINEGEYTKGGDWLSYLDERFGGFESRPPDGAKPLIAQGKDREAFAEFYQYASEKGTLFYLPGTQIKQVRPIRVCTGPITYAAQKELAKEIDLLLASSPKERAFLTSTAPASIDRATRVTPAWLMRNAPKR